MLEENDIKKIGEELGKVIEQNITPAMEAMRTELSGEIGKLRSDIIDHVDRKFNEANGELARVKNEILAMIKGDRERDVEFKIKIIEVLDRSKLLQNEEVPFLQQLAR